MTTAGKPNAARKQPPVRKPRSPRGKQAQRAAEIHPQFDLPNQALVDLWYKMVLARRIAERWFILNRQGRAPFVITGQGHEATQVGTAAALTPGKDWVVPYYRDIGVVLALGMTLYELMLNVFAKADDPNSGGRQMPTHWSRRDLRIVSGSSVVATQVPIAAGVAWAAKLRGEDSVTVAYLGEGSTNQGDFHEGLNFASVQRLPLIVVVENNGYAITEQQEKEMAIQDVADRAAAYGIPGVVIDGNDLLEVYRTMQWAVHEARAGHGPTLLEAKTYRTVPPLLRRRRPTLPHPRGVGALDQARSHRPLPQALDRRRRPHRRARRATAERRHGGDPRRPGPGRGPRRSRPRHPP